ncbi:MAG: hypothetical protein CMG50_03460 [Candidatus Marinimicrobia bacterium]|nr:hypothetical protein [Candidatus Neomarinimicrobiota bacterium]
MNYKYIYIILIIYSFVFSADATEKKQNSSFYNKDGSSKINLISSNISETTLEITVDGHIVNEVLENQYNIKIDKGSPILLKGAPDLPRLNTSIIIPDQANMSIKVIDSDYIELEDINIIPSKGNLTRDINPSSVPYTYSKHYQKDTFYPNNLVSLGNPYIIRDVRGQSVIINPIQYNPITKILRIYNRIVVNIYEDENIFNKKTKNSIQRYNSEIKSSKEFNNIYNNLFINFPQDLRFEYISDQGNMLIICYDDFLEPMNPFVEWKNKKGIPTEIVALSSIGNTVDVIQDFINDYYNNNGLSYLLLVGDAAQLPTHIINGSASDPTYGFIQGDDAYSEIIVGRFSGNNLSHIETQVQRTIEYEKFENFDSSHLSKALGIASTQGPGYGGLSDNEFNDLLANDFLLEYTYDNYQGLYDSNSSVSDGIDAINEGVGLINYTGHAGPTGWGNGAPLNGSDVNNLVNTNKLPFIFTVGCNPGQFNDYTECFCESWMWSTDNNGNPTGAVGHLGSTISQSWEPPMHGQWAMNAILTESYDEHLTRSFGGIVVNGCMHMNEAQGSSGINETKYWTLFGDPSLSIRTDEPDYLEPIYNQNILLGQTEFVVDVGIEGALVALSSNGILQSSAYSIGGVAVLDVSNITTSPGSLDMIISGFNNFPYESTLEFISADGPFLVYNNFEIINDSNFNNLIEYGDEISLNLLVDNVGNINTDNISVTLNTDDEFISISNSSSVIEYAYIGQSSSTDEPLVFSVSNNVPDGHIVNFTANLNDGEREWNINFNTHISAPIFEILNPVLTDDNQDSMWDAGESATISLDLVNSGSASFGYYPGATISTASPYVTIISGENDNTFYAIDSNASYEGQFIVLADPSTPIGTVVDFNISWGYSPTAPCDNEYFIGEGCVEQASLIYSAIIGHPSILIWDPTNEHQSGEKLVDFFNQNNIEGFDYIDSSEIQSVENYNTAFILLGVYPNNYVLQDSQSDSFLNLLNNGGNIYMEGADTWAFDSQTDLHSHFGLAGEADGSADLSTINGIEGTFTEGLSFNYNSDNSYIDRIVPSGGFSIMQNENPEYTTAVAYQNDELDYRTIGSSHNLAGLEGNYFFEYIYSIINFFDSGSNINPECFAGDVNNDGSIDVVDIVRLVNIIINSGNPTDQDELCASDINEDGIINVQDIVIITGIILSNDRLGINTRSRIVNEVDVKIENNSFNLKTEGSIRGLEMIINSEDAIFINNDIDMDIAYNINEDKHHIVIYSIEGKFIRHGNHKLFESAGFFEVEQMLAVNSNNEPVNILINENMYPQEFLLKQNFPNPFNPITNIEISLSSSENIKLIIFDINGKEIKKLADGFYKSGSYNFSWNSQDANGFQVSSGVYIYQLITDNNVFSKKMLLLK